MDATIEHMERLLRQSAQGKLKESRALAQHWREYQRICGVAVPMCPLCNLHFPGFMKLCQHVVRRVDFEENTTPVEVQQELDRLTGKNKTQNNGIKGTSTKVKLKHDDDAEIPDHSTGHRDVLSLILEFLCGINDKLITRQYQMELLTQVICPRSQPRWHVLHLKKEDGMKDVSEKADGVDNVEDEDVDEDKQDVRNDNEGACPASSDRSNEKQTPTVGPPTSTKGLFRCLVNSCNKEFFTFKDHLEDVFLNRSFWQRKGTLSTNTDIKPLLKVRMNHWNMIFADVMEPDFQRLCGTDFMAMCSACGAHFRGGTRTRFGWTVESHECRSSFVGRR